jgi:hypothetical protein
MRRIVIAALGAVFLMGLTCCGSSSRLRSTREIQATIARDYAVVLTPPMQTGWAGWCLAIASADGCLTPPTFRGPIVSVAQSPVSGSSQVLYVVLTRPDVSAVAVDGGAPLATRIEAGLPNGIRAVVVEVPRQRELVGYPVRLPTFTPINVRGLPIKQPREVGKPLLVSLFPRVHWQAPSHPPKGVCEIDATSVRGLEAKWGNVLTSTRSYSDGVGRAFLSCADTEFYFDNWPLDAAVLLYASRPRATPASLPASRPLPEHAGFVQSVSSAGPLVGRRIAGAWLVVSGGRDLQQRITVLEHVRAAVR